MLSFIKIFINKDNLYNYKGAGVKWTIVTAIKCVSANR